MQWKVRLASARANEELWRGPLTRAYVAELVLRHVGLSDHRDVACMPVDSLSCLCFTCSLSLVLRMCRHRLR